MRAKEIQILGLVPVDAFIVGRDEEELYGCDHCFFITMNRHCWSTMSFIQRVRTDFDAVS